MNKSNKSASPHAASTNGESKGEQRGESGGISHRLRVIRRQLEGLCSGYSPAFGNRVQELLQHSPPTDQAMLDAWTRIGHGDAARSPRIDLIHANESSVSPLGVACLVSYARGYLDELEQLQAAAQTLAAAPSPDPEPEDREPQQPLILPCGCRWQDRDLCGHGNAPLA